MPENATTIYTERLPPWMQPYYENLAQYGQDEILRPYTPYGGNRLAGFTGLENAAMTGIGALGMSGGPMQQRYATQGLQSAMGGIQGLAPGVSNYTNRFMDVYNTAMPQMSTDVDWQKYMNPYTANVTDIAEREARRFGNVQRSELGSRAASAGAFGGYRHGLQESAIDQNTAQLMSDIRVQGLEKAFDRGLGMFMDDRAASMGGQGLRMQALQGGLGGFNTAAGLYGSLGNMAGAMGGLGSLEQSMQYERLNSMEAAGARQRALQQAGLDIGYQDFLAQRDYPRESMSWYGSILGGFPHQSMRNVSQSTMQNNPGLFQSMLGTGISGLGMWGAINGGFGQPQVAYG